MYSDKTLNYTLPVAMSKPFHLEVEESNLYIYECINNRLKKIAMFPVWVNPKNILEVLSF